MAMKIVQYNQIWKIEQTLIFDLSDLIWPRRSDLRSSGPPKSRSLSNFGLMMQPWKMTPFVSFNMSKSDMASLDLGGHGGWPQYVENHSAHLERPHAKNQPNRLETVAVMRAHTWLQTPGTNLQLYIKMFTNEINLCPPNKMIRQSPPNALWLSTQPSSVASNGSPTFHSCYWNTL